MGQLFLLRHGQASLGADDYDRLSDLGRRQARLLGRHWAETEYRFDRVVVGPLRRHRETLEELAAGVAEAGGTLPAALTVDAMREHQAVEVVKRTLAADADSAARPSGDLKDAWFQHFDRIMRGWIRGETSFDDLENWQEARARVRAALPGLAEPADVNTLAVTSGGFICMLIGEVLSLDDIAIYELALELRNGAWTELRLSSMGPRLMAFNAHPHLASRELRTLV